uniref:hypothetical protein n=1 Tax=Aeromonas sp. QDB11 TaxID=2990482 RepID=UPI0022E32FAA
MPKTRKHLTPTEAEAKGLLCRKHLKERLRLMPGLNTKPAGSVWQGQGAYDVYNPAECVPWRWMPGRAQVRRQHVAAAYSHAWRSLNNIHADHVITSMPITQ